MDDDDDRATAGPGPDAAAAGVAPPAGAALPGCPRCGADVRDAAARFCRVCGAALPSAAREPDSLVGRTVLGRYHVERVVGQGGMGRVYVAEQRIGRAARKVAVKVLSPDLSRDKTVVARFHREAATILELSHPNTVRVYDFGEEDGRLLLVMEYVDGKRLAELLAHGPVPYPRALAIAAQIAGSLEEAHHSGVIHRDLKPENVILTDLAGAPQLVKVLDFGVAKHVDHDLANPSITARGTLVGTPAYMSPEQFTGLPLDARSDVYALGLIVYQMLAGALPWRGANVYEWAGHHVRDPVPSLRERAPGLPGRVYAAVERALAKLPDDRPASALAFARELTGLAPGSEAFALVLAGGLAAVPEHLGPAASRASTAGEAPTRSAPPSRPSDLAALAARVPRPPPPPGARWLALAGLFVVAVGLGFGAVAWLVGARARSSSAARPSVARDAGSSRARDARDATAHDAGAADAAPGDVEPGAVTAAHPNFARAEQSLAQARAALTRGALAAALTSVETAHDLVGPRWTALAPVRAELARRGARELEAMRRGVARDAGVAAQPPRPCAQAQALMRRLRRAGAEPLEAHALFDRRACPLP